MAKDALKQSANRKRPADDIKRLAHTVFKLAKFYSWANKRRFENTSFANCPDDMSTGRPAHGT